MMMKLFAALTGLLVLSGTAYAASCCSDGAPCCAHEMPCCDH